MVLTLNGYAIVANLEKQGTPVTVVKATKSGASVSPAGRPICFYFQQIATRLEEKGLSLNLHSPTRPNSTLLK